MENYSIKARTHEIISQVNMLRKHNSELVVEKKNIAFDNDMVMFKKYTVVANDTLRGICNKQKIDFRNSIEEIIRINNITDANLIYSGQTVLLPIK